MEEAGLLSDACKLVATERGERSANERAPPDLFAFELRGLLRVVELI